MTTTQNPEAFAPGEYIRDEIEARGWSQIDLAEILGRPPQAVNEIINGKKAITPDTAKALGEAFGTSAQLWMNLESAYQLAKSGVSDDLVARKAKMYAFSPIGEMQKRGWIETSSNFNVVESQVLRFFGIKSLNQPVEMALAARKSTGGDLTSAQRAWFCRAKQLARIVPVSGSFSERSANEAIRQLALLKAEPEEARKVPKVLSAAGIRFLVVAPFPQSKIDGVCFWLSAKAPVIAVSFRFERIDWFWHTLMHEMGHVLNGDGKTAVTIDTDLVGSDAQPEDQKSHVEAKADAFAAQFLIDRQLLADFVARVHPMYSRTKVVGFAKSVDVHPGIVVGQLQYQKKMPYTHHRLLLVPVRSIVTGTALTDGWGHQITV